jgi:hypothetical protein
LGLTAFAKRANLCGDYSVMRTTRRAEDLPMKLAHLVVASITLASVSACSDQTIPTDPAVARSASESVASTDMGGTTDRTVNLMDACDGPSFALAGVSCTRNHGIQFDDLIAQLAATGSAGAWHNAPSQMDAKVGLTLTAVNKGGELHTFTKVAKFGGGFVPDVNNLLHLTPTPECMAVSDGSTLILPGGADTDDIVQPGTTLYQCCIHPWMQTVVNGKG